ncbi:hypothetical protein [Rubrivirga sp. IMCC45206]|uniref:hypothetical protein n=1 Tax=Rubrivirga sp. IMCC45206 TaxID=3391614 RepID=UPI00398FD3C7
MFDALQPHASDTFDRAAAVVRAGRPAPDRRRPLALAAALAVAVGACATPVETETLVGFAVEWTTYGEVGPGHHTMKALDAVVAAPARLAVETREAERPHVPADHDWPRAGTWTRVRYTARAPRRAPAEAWADTMRALVGAYNVAVEPVVRTERRALAVRALGRIGQAVSVADPELSDADLQALLDRVENLPEPFRARVERLPDGRRILVREGLAIVLAEGVRLWIRPDDPRGQPIQYEGVGTDEFLFDTDDGWRPMRDVFREHLPREARRAR